MSDMVYAMHHELGPVIGTLRKPDQIDLETFDPEWLPQGSDPSKATIMNVNMEKYCGDVWLAEGVIGPF